MKSVPERDWKLFTRLHPVALDRFCRSVLEKAGAILSRSEGDSHKTYLALYKFLQKQDEELGQIFNDYRRSTTFFQIAMMYDRNLLTEEEFQEFSPETVNMILGLRNGFGN